jgi:predicted metal-dependent hydrolase
MSATVTSKRAKARDAIVLDGRRVEYTIRISAQSKRVRARVGPSGVEVVLPAYERENRAPEFLQQNAAWVVGQLRRVDGLKRLRLPRRPAKTILLRGREVAVIVGAVPSGRGTNLVEEAESRVVIRPGSNGRTQPIRTLEYWLRRQARQDIEASLKRVLPRVGRRPNRVYVMGQRTKWGNCSSLGNLSFNWRLVMAPPFVLEYVVIHEAMHLAIPNHSQEFWLTVRSLCPDTEKARAWLRQHQELLMLPLDVGIATDGSRCQT